MCFFWKGRSRSRCSVVRRMIPFLLLFSLLGWESFVALKDDLISCPVSSLLKLCGQRHAHGLISACKSYRSLYEDHSLYLSRGSEYKEPNST